MLVLRIRRFDEKRREKELVAFGLRISLSTMKEGETYMLFKQTKEEERKMNTI